MWQLGQLVRQSVQLVWQSGQLVRQCGIVVVVALKPGWYDIHTRYPAIFRNKNSMRLWRFNWSGNEYNKQNEDRPA